MPTPNSKLVFATAFAAAALVAATNAQAAPRHHVSERVFYADLNLATPQGAKAMLKRIADTVRELCEPERSPAIIPPAREADTARCRAEAMERAVARLDAPLVTAEYDRIRRDERRLAAAN
jgi:UrcA family protein